MHKGELLMRLGKYTEYKGKTYEVLNYNEGKNVVKLLYLLDENHEIKSKIVKRKDVGEIYSIQTNCSYKGHRFQVIAEEEKDILIYTGNVKIGIELGMKFIERSVYHKWIKKSEADKIWEDKDIMNY